MNINKLNIAPAFPSEVEEHLPDYPMELDPEEGIFTDHFVLETEVFNQEHLIDIVLPKFIMHPTKSIKEKSFLLLTFLGSHESKSMYAQVLNAAKSEIGKFKIHFTNEEGNVNISTWTFDGVRVHAVDFGHVARQRPDKATITVELEYNSITIDEISF